MMKTTFEHFEVLSAGQLQTVNGGSFAYDLGRVIRFIGLVLPGDSISVANAITDWQITTLLNNADNG